MIALMVFSCCKTKEDMNKNVDIIFLHHSTGKLVWDGARPSIVTRVINKFLPSGYKMALVPRLIRQYNKKHNTNYTIENTYFPKPAPYGWNNFPYDYYNIWVAHAGDKPYKDEPTLEILTKKYQVIVWKHCFPVSGIEEDTGTPDMNSDIKSIENYTLQYETLKKKMKEFPDTKFIVWTGPALPENATKPESAKRADAFFKWVKNDWDEPGDNIFIWDFRTIETDGGLYLPDNFGLSPGDSHPNGKITVKAATLLVNRITDVIENDGLKTDIQGNPVR